MRKDKKNKHPKPQAIDLFCGCGGLTLGLKQAGFEVVAGVELDNLAASSYRNNHRNTQMYQGDIQTLNPIDIMQELGIQKGELTLLAGCPPCQGFSTLRTGNGSKKIDDPMNDLVFEFIRFTEAILPKAIMMENVPGLASDYRVSRIVTCLEQMGYNCDSQIFDASKFGVPQRRRRMILVGLQNQKPIFAPEKKKRVNVRQAIGALPQPGNSGDPLHNYKVNRTSRIIELINKIPLDGGSRTDLPFDDQLPCHQKCNGYKDTYGRMTWSKPAPTITGGCINPSKGRFLHPEQNRAITLREAALLQGFPKNFKFDLSNGLYATAQMIGNAFPPTFAKEHAKSLLASLYSEA